MKDIKQIIHEGAVKALESRLEQDAEQRKGSRVLLLGARVRGHTVAEMLLVKPDADAREAFKLLGGDPEMLTAVVRDVQAPPKQGTGTSFKEVWMPDEEVFGVLRVIGVPTGNTMAYFFASCPVAKVSIDDGIPTYITRLDDDTKFYSQWPGNRVFIAGDCVWMVKRACGGQMPRGINRRRHGHSANFAAKAFKEYVGDQLEGFESELRKKAEREKPAKPVDRSNVVDLVGKKRKTPKAKRASVKPIKPIAPPDAPECAKKDNDGKKSLREAIEELKASEDKALAAESAEAAPETVPDVTPDTEAAVRLAAESDDPMAAFKALAETDPNIAKLLRLAGVKVDESDQAAPAVDTEVVEGAEASGQAGADAETEAAAGAEASGQAGADAEVDEEAKAVTEFFSM